MYIFANVHNSLFDMRFSVSGVPPCYQAWIISCSRTFAKLREFARASFPSDPPCIPRLCDDGCTDDFNGCLESQYPM